MLISKAMQHDKLSLQKIDPKLPESRPNSNRTKNQSV
jgi:hypothetical protein